MRPDLFSICNIALHKQLKETPGSLCPNPLSKDISGDRIKHKNFPMTLHLLKWCHHRMHAKLLMKLACNKLGVHWIHVNYVSQSGSAWTFLQKVYPFWFPISEYNRLRNSLKEDGVSGSKIHNCPGWFFFFFSVGWLVFFGTKQKKKNLKLWKSLNSFLSIKIGSMLPYDFFSGRHWISDRKSLGDRRFR